MFLTRKDQARAELIAGALGRWDSLTLSAKRPAIYVLELMTGLPRIRKAEVKLIKEVILNGNI